jgi:hypothetical protein
MVLTDCQQEIQGMSPSVVQQFLWRVRRRQRIVALARQGRLFLLIAMGIFACALLCSRFFGVFPGWFTPVTLTAFLVVASILACILYRRAGITDAARLADAELDTHDLFLTASLVEHSLGAYQDLVLMKAERRAAKGVPRNVVPYHWQRGTVQLCAVLALLGVGVYLLPQFDPFGLHQQRRQLAEQRERVRQLGKATEARATLLEQKRAGEQTDVVKQAVANLEKAFQGAKPNDKAGTLARLNEQQKVLGQLWKQASEERLKNALNLPPPAQSFGVADPTKTEQMRNDLQKGDVSSAKKELDALKQKVEELAATRDPVTREKLRQELMDRLQNMKDTLDQQLNSQALDADLQRALEQLALSNVPELSGESLKGMSHSLNLTQEELQRLAQAMADMRNIEEALKALQLAKTLNNLQPLNGQDFIKLGDLAAYAAFCNGKCKSLLAGMGLGAGYGYGPRPYGDENSTNRFQPEKSAPLLQPGRMLMEWKTREVSEAGPAREEYLRAVQDVRQQASEAVLEEQIPPGYHAAIKKYFDTLPHDAGAARP